MNEQLNLFPSEANQRKVQKRDEEGMVINYPYVYNEDGLPNWKAMVPKEFIYINPDTKRRSEIEKKYGKSYEELDVVNDKIEDKHLVIALGGIRFLLRLRGYSYLNYHVNKSERDYASVNASIGFIPNYESENRNLEWSDNACAHPDNTNGFGQKYLIEMASNRAFCRCVRSFLGIGIVSQDELGTTNITESPVENLPSDILSKTMKENSITFEQLKLKLIEEKFEGAEKFMSVSDIPKFHQFALISRIKSKAAEKKA